MHFWLDLFLVFLLQILPKNTRIWKWELSSEMGYGGGGTHRGGGENPQVWYLFWNCFIQQSHECFCLFIGMVHALKTISLSLIVNYTCEMAYIWRKLMEGKYLLKPSVIRLLPTDPRFLGYLRFLFQVFLRIFGGVFSSTGNWTRIVSMASTCIHHDSMRMYDWM